MTLSVAISAPRSAPTPNWEASFMRPGAICDELGVRHEEEGATRGARSAVRHGRVAPAPPRCHRSR